MHLDIEICQSPGEAIERGYVYREPEFKGIKINKAVVVKNGTVEGNATIDLILEDETGQKFVVMTTQNLVKMLANMA